MPVDDVEAACAAAAVSLAVHPRTAKPVSAPDSSFVNAGRLHQVPALVHDRLRWFHAPHDCEGKRA